MKMPLTEWIRVIAGGVAPVVMIAVGASVIGKLAPEDRASGWLVFGAAWVTAAIAMAVAIRIMDRREPGGQVPVVFWWGVSLLLAGIAASLGVRYHAGLLGAGGGALTAAVISIAVITIRTYSREAQPDATSGESGSADRHHST